MIMMRSPFVRVMQHIDYYFKDKEGLYRVVLERSRRWFVEAVYKPKD